ncbi:MAG: response regulator transcription factor [Deltaproteobacteria bacterium]|nr:response regulator transcription factor [Deltaproteobacteria bacterium]
MTKDVKTILLIEDETDLVLGLTDAFEFEGYSVHAAQTGEKGVEQAETLNPDLIILDLMLPGMNGFNVCSTIRKRDTTTPILILSARSQENDIIRGLESGADDYVTKPFSIGELLARVRAIFRRIAPGRDHNSSRLIKVGDAEINVDTYTAVVGNKQTDLGFYATAILHVLDERRGEPVSRDEILDAVWGIDANPTNRTIDNFILKLRRVVEKNPAKPRHILTVYGQGYKLAQ